MDRAEPTYLHEKIQDSRHDMLEEIDRGGVANHDLARSRAHQPRDLFPHPGRGLVPAGVPALDEIAPPFHLHHRPHAAAGPADRPVGIVAEVLVAVGCSVPRNGSPLGVLDLRVQAAGRRGGEVGPRTDEDRAQRIGPAAISEHQG